MKLYVKHLLIFGRSLSVRTNPWMKVFPMQILIQLAEQQRSLGVKRQLLRGMPPKQSFRTMRMTRLQQKDKKGRRTSRAVLAWATQRAVLQQHPQVPPKVVLLRGLCPRRVLLLRHQLQQQPLHRRFPRPLSVPRLLLQQRQRQLLSLVHLEHLLPQVVNRLPQGPRRHLR